MDTPDFFVGARLGGARIKAGITLEKAAKDTRIRAQRLREIEADDFSGFAHPTYSRLFLLDYAEYLGIPADEIRPLLPDRAGAAGGGFQYINALSSEFSTPVVEIRHKNSGLFRMLLIAGAVVLVGIVGFFAYFTLKKIERVTGSSSLSGKSVPAPVSPTPSPTAATGTEASAQPAQVENALPTPDASNSTSSEMPSSNPVH
jgi:cytoskeletal protein RodZ